MKNNKLKISVIASIVLTICFVLFTILVKFVDVAYVGFSGKKVGLSTINKFFFDAVKVNDLIDKLSDIFMVASIMIVAFVIVVAIIELVKRKSFKKLDKEIYAFGIVVVLMILTYVLFEIIKLNYRPILIDGEIEASYPSTHTMLALTVFMCAIVYAFNNLKSKKYKSITCAVMGTFIVLAVLFRILSGMHWITDIIASIILSLMFASYYVLINCLIKTKSAENKK